MVLCRFLDSVHVSIRMCVLPKVCLCQKFQIFQWDTQSVDIEPLSCSYRQRSLISASTGALSMFSASISEDKHKCIPLPHCRLVEHFNRTSEQYAC